MTVGEIIYAILVALQGIGTVLSIILLVLSVVKDDNSDKMLTIALFLLAISPLFSIIGVFFGFYL